MCLDGRQPHIGEALHVGVERGVVEVERVRMGQRNDTTGFDNPFDDLRGFRLATGHVAGAVNADPVFEGVLAAGRRAGRDQRIGDVGAADVELGSSAHVVPREVETKTLQAFDHLARPGLTVALLHVRPRNKCGGHGVGKPCEQVALAVGIVAR